MYAQRVAVEPIQALIIQPDNTYEVREISQDPPTRQGLVGGYVERVHTEHADLWFDEGGKIKGYPINWPATWLWWKLCPEMEDVDVIAGPCFVTGRDDDAAYSMPVSQGVVGLFERIMAVIGDQGSSGEPTP